MPPERALKLVDSDGQISDEAPSYHDALMKLAELIGDVANLERENTRLLRKVRAVERNLEAQRLADPQRQAILALIDRWKQKCNHPRSNANAGDRFDLVKARLKEGYEVEDLEQAIDGIAARPYVVNGQRLATGKPSQRHDRMGIALGGGEAVERFANLNAEAKRD